MDFLKSWMLLNLEPFCFFIDFNFTRKLSLISGSKKESAYILIINSIAWDLFFNVF